jgi:signal transduction histidine kinase
MALALAAGLLGGMSLVPAGSLDSAALATVGAVLATTLTFGVAWVNVVVWRMTGDQRSVFLAAAALCLAVFPLTLGVILPALAPSAALDHIRLAFSIAGVAGIAVLALGAWESSAAFAARSVRSVLAAAVAASASVAALGAVLPFVRDLAVESGPALPLAFRPAALALALVFVAMSVTYAAVTRRCSGRLLSWTGVALSGVAVAYAIEAVDGPLAHPAAWLMLSAAVTVGLYGATVELQRHRAEEHREALDSVVMAEIATSRARAVDRTQAERRHEVRAAMFGIEAAAQSLNRHRRLLTNEQFDELSAGLVAEVYRLRTMFEGQARSTTTFELRQALLPVITVTRADGLDVRCDVPPGVEVDGVAEDTAQIVLGLLRNAQQHAPGSPVELRVEIDDVDVHLYVEDHGPGIADGLHDRLFQRGVRCDSSAGSGLGLFIAGELAGRQGGSITARNRTIGGACFDLRLRRSPGRPGPADLPGPAELVAAAKPALPAAAPVAPVAPTATGVAPATANTRLTVVS